MAAPALAAITSAACTAEKEATAFLVLGAEEATDFAAIAARIIPTTDTPGAAEAGVIHFFDNAFADAMSEQHADAQNGLAEFTVFLADIGEWGEMNEVYKTFFPNKPARSAVGVSGIGLDGRVEIECIAVIR